MLDDARRRLLDDLSQVATSAAGLLQGAGKEVETLVRQRVDQVVERLDLVTREEFDAVSEMAANARSENDSLRSELDALKAELAALKAAKPKRAPARKAAAKKPAAKRPASRKTTT